MKKFVLVTSIGTGDSKDAPPKQVYDVLKSVLVEKGKAEDKLKVPLLQTSLPFSDCLMTEYRKPNVKYIFCKYSI